LKIHSKKYWQDVKSFVNQISLKFRNFHLIKMNLVQIVLQTSASKYR